jgi:hypothetical protein
MAGVTVLYWRDIPAQVNAKAGRKTAKRQLPERFQVAIDMAAMRSRAHEAGSYLEEWRRGDPVECGNDLEKEVVQAATQIESDYDDARLIQLIKEGGVDDA